MRDITQFTTRGGKRIRGHAVLLGHVLAGGTISRSIYDATVAVELIHAEALLHDDIIDRDTIRRRKPTFHMLYAKYGKGRSNPAHYGLSQAIIAGDYVAGLALELVGELRFPAERKVVAQKILTRIALLTCVGEAQDIWFSHNPQVTRQKIIRMLRFKSGQYSIVAPLQFGAALAGAKPKMMAQLSEFGEHLGLAFQLRDDWLNFTASTQNIGKDAASDLREGKSTLLLYEAQRAMGVAQRKTLVRNLKKAQDPRAIAAIHRSIAATNAQDKILRLAFSEAEKTRAMIPQITKNPVLARALEQLTQFVVERTA